MINVVEKDYVFGFVYVAILKVKKLRGLLFKVLFDYDRFKVKTVFVIEVIRLADVVVRLLQYVSFEVLKM